MNQDAIKLAAAHLLEVADALVAEGHQEVEPFIAALRPLIERAMSGRITAKLGWSEVPGDWLMSETPLRQFRELETAYADFKIELTGGETPVLRRLRQMMEDKQ